MQGLEGWGCNGSTAPPESEGDSGTRDKTERRLPEQCPCGGRQCRLQRWGASRCRAPRSGLLGGKSGLRAGCLPSRPGLVSPKAPGAGEPSYL